MYFFQAGALFCTDNAKFGYFGQFCLFGCEFNALLGEQGVGVLRLTNISYVLTLLTLITLLTLLSLITLYTLSTLFKQIWSKTAIKPIK